MDPLKARGTHRALDPSSGSDAPMRQARSANSYEATVRLHDSRSRVELEDHRERRLVRQASLGAHGAMAQVANEISMTLVVRRWFQCSDGKS
jgi:hypothetical protein